MTTEDLIARIKNPHWSDRADSLLKEAADALEAQGREVAELKPLAALGAEMHAMTTTVHTDSIPFKEQLQIVPSLWLECMKERDKARAEIQNQYRCIESHAAITQKAEAECDTLRAELAAIRAQEPVAWRWKFQFRDIGETGAYEYHSHAFACLAHMPKGEPLYAAPVPTPDVGALVELMRYMRSVASFERNEEIDAAIESLKDNTP